MVSINAIIFSKYIFGEVYCGYRSHPENILFIRRIAKKMAEIQLLTWKASLQLSRDWPGKSELNSIRSGRYLEIVR